MQSWGKELETGYDELDREHRILLDMAHEVVRAVHTNTPRVKAVSLLEKFVDYVNRHHDTEEGIMESFSYPALELHINEHREMQTTLAGIMERYRLNGQSALVTLMLRNVVRQWFSDHIKEHDKPLVVFLANQLKITSPPAE